jgi:hypothetical protein
MDAADTFFAFMLYQLPNSFRDEPDDTDWLKFRVRAGTVAGLDAVGTDGATNPNVPSYPDVDDIVAQTGCAKFWFWLELADGVWTVRWGPDPTASSYTPTGASEPDWTSDNPWAAVPVPDSEHIPIGWVDTTTDKDPVIRQLLTGDVVSLSGGDATWLP